MKKWIGHFCTIRDGLTILGRLWPICQRSQCLLFQCRVLQCRLSQSLPYPLQLLLKLPKQSVRYFIFIFMLRRNLRPVNSLTFVSSGPYGVNLDVLLITGCWSCQPQFEVGFEEAK